MHSMDDVVTAVAEIQFFCWLRTFFSLNSLDSHHNCIRVLWLSFGYVHASCRCCNQGVVPENIHPHPLTEEIQNASGGCGGGGGGGSKGKKQKISKKV